MSNSNEKGHFPKYGGSFVVVVVVVVVDDVVVAAANKSTNKNASGKINIEDSVHPISREFGKRSHLTCGVSHVLVKYELHVALRVDACCFSVVGRSSFRRGRRRGDAATRREQSATIKVRLG